MDLQGKIVIFTFERPAENALKGKINLKKRTFGKLSVINHAKRFSE